MSVLKFNPRNAVLLLIIIIIAIIRVLNNFSTGITPLANYSPLAAMALFGGAYFGGRIKPLAFPLAAIFISDVILFATVYKQYGNGFLYSGWVWVYAAFLLIAWSAKLIIKKVKVHSLVMAIVVAVLIHWIVADLGVWIGSAEYEQNLSGFTACLIAAIPFELRLLTATIIYSAIMFVVFEWMKKRFHVLQTI
ncbi:MAG: hypothetical protein JST87_09800 [Bacteroidetes bacterium]|nr:hypothetical protein [Bacteroidota bacterium]